MATTNLLASPGNSFRLYYLQHFCIWLCFPTLQYKGHASWSRTKLEKAAFMLNRRTVTPTESFSLKVKVLHSTTTTTCAFAAELRDMSF